MIVQIYEIQEPREAALMAECGVDHIGGVILSPGDWKIPALKESVGVIREAGRKSSIIPLFADPDAVHRVIEFYAPDIVHFCDSLNQGPWWMKSLSGLRWPFRGVSGNASRRSRS